jgi:diguanylate cyclase (GGDEF)-like protein
MAGTGEEGGANETRQGPIGDVFARVPESVKAALVLLSVALLALLAAVSVSRRQLAAALRRAHSDTLTGLPNRAAIDETLKRMTAQAARTGRPLGVVMLDIDHFKSVNDTYGHAKGDEVLAAVGAVARSAVRAGDFVGRFGGEELMVLMPETGEGGALRVAEKLHAAVRAIEIPGIGEGVTASFGVAAGRGDQDRLRRLVHAADEALYRAKGNGRDAVEVARRDASVALVA